MADVTKATDFTMSGQTAPVTRDTRPGQNGPDPSGGRSLPRAGEARPMRGSERSRRVRSAHPPIAASKMETGALAQANADGPGCSEQPRLTARGQRSLQQRSEFGLAPRRSKEVPPTSAPHLGGSRQDPGWPTVQCPPKTWSRGARQAPRVSDPSGERIMLLPPLSLRSLVTAGKGNSHRSLSLLLLLLF